MCTRPNSENKCWRNSIGCTISINAIAITIHSDKCETFGHETSKYLFQFQAQNQFFCENTAHMAILHCVRMLSRDGDGWRSVGSTIFKVFHIVHHIFNG